MEENSISISQEDAKIETLEFGALDNGLFIQKVRFFEKTHPDIKNWRVWDEAVKREVSLRLLNIVNDITAEKKRVAALEYHKDSTVGLWATDRPDLFADHPEFHLLFKITFPEL